MKYYLFFISVITLISFQRMMDEYLDVDCWAFAMAAEGEAGDAGDFEVFSHAYDYCYEYMRD